MLQLKSIGTPLVLALALFAMSGCDQAEKSAQQMLDQAAESAKQAIDKTNDAAQQALSDAIGGDGGKAKTEDDKKDTQDI
ncbi:hypothetical protein EON09_09545 [Pseudomonas soli]|jgi:vacuolar-type H+-ATPase subunit H|uniref:Lipoprotein n=1 Tax=Pseudomonas soli TaxID=1306993 RepID=A0A1H9E6A5_9PSED|nr:MULTISPECIES: hypothetical protein [Pseudomonas]AIN57759.1 lipoprotein [Pseudomonas soli]AUY32767.1 hypothetical protein C3F42_05815 [Pseudomonas sp. PONIH3]MCX5508339.1 hypothetical protein [Pseudomonas sp. BJa3]MDT3712870.1 hypothetical protein [Pseudomonas soli]MDT3730206.1 hypothetical protein [Pseudomonas soli]